MSDPPLSDIDSKNKMVWVWTTLETQNQAESGHWTYPPYKFTIGNLLDEFYF